MSPRTAGAADIPPRKSLGRRVEWMAHGLIGCTRTVRFGSLDTLMGTLFKC